MDNEQDRRSRRLTLSTENFDDYYLVVLTAKCLSNVHADKVLAGELQTPLIKFQRDNVEALQRLHVPWFSPAQLLTQPTQTFHNFLRSVTSAILRAPAPVPDVGDLNALQAEQEIYRQTENHIYSSIVTTLEVGKTIHYTRQCTFGAGQLLLQTIVTDNDNRQETTRSLMTVFSALICLHLGDSETFEQFSHRVELLIQRLLN